MAVLTDASTERPADVRGPWARRTGGRRAQVLGAVIAQVVQALGGLVLSVAAARLTGAAGLATFSLVYGAIVLAAAVASGLVGDSWTVLDRADPSVRAALLRWAGLVLTGTGTGAVVLAWALGGMSGPGALTTGAATGAFLLQELVRRALMSAGRFWSLPLMDGLGLLVTLSVLLGVVGAGVPAGLVLVLASLAVGQLLSALVGWVLLPADVRYLPRGARPDMRAVWAFGSWRAAGQAVKPTVLTLVRTIVVVGLGAAAYGPLEAARVYTAPVLVLVTGVGSFLLPHYVASRERAAAEVLRGADRAVLRLAGISTVLGTAAVLLIPVLGPLLTGPGFGVPVLAVAGWSGYAVASAVLLPYAGLATVSGGQRRLLLLRSLEAVSLVGVAAVVVWAPDRVALAPFALALGPLCTAWAMRRWLASRAQGRARPAR